MRHINNKWVLEEGEVILRHPCTDRECYATLSRFLNVLHTLFTNQTDIVNLTPVKFRELFADMNRWLSLDVDANTLEVYRAVAFGEVDSEGKGISFLIDSEGYSFLGVREAAYGATE